MLICNKCRNDAAEGNSALARDLGNLLCGGDACTGSQICCGCGCGANCTSGPICRRTGFFTRGGTCREDEDVKSPSTGEQIYGEQGHGERDCLSELFACLIRFK